MVIRVSLVPDRPDGVGAGQRRQGSAFPAKPGLLTLYGGRERARHPRGGNQRLESRVRENRTHGSEGGEAKAFPTPILSGAERVTSGLQVEVLPSVAARRYPDQVRL